VQLTHSEKNGYTVIGFEGELKIFNLNELIEEIFDISDFSSILNM
jgi:hypothetical protein